MPRFSIAHSQNSAGVLCAENFDEKTWHPTQRQNPLSKSQRTDKHDLEKK
jgi:hypothetical protein|tara:strand:- start:192 stop:341 length:150 start_codon:yes stop_codon:yes gene_type:complete